MLRRAADDHRGRGRFDGTSFIASFDSASDAVYCAVTLQGWLAGRAPARVGIYLAEEAVDGEIGAEALAMARRIAATAEPGAIRVSQAVYDMVKARPEIRVAPLGDGFAVLTHSQAETRRARSSRSGPIALVAVAVAAAIVWFGWRQLQVYRGPTQERFTIALPPFSSSTDTAEAEVMRTLVRHKLDDELGRDNDVRILWDGLRESPADEAQARALGTRLRADMVIWGEVASRRRETEIKPHITMVRADGAKTETEVVHASLDEPDQITLHEQKADELGNLALMAVARYYFGRKDYTKALSILHRVSPPGSNSIALEALALYRLGRGEEMAAKLREIKHPTPYQRGLLAWNRFISGDGLAAARELESLRRDDPKDAKLLQMLEYVYLDLGGPANLAKALSINDQARALAPNHPFIASDRGAILYEQGKYREAAAEFEALSRKSPSNFFATFIAVSAFRRAGDAPTAARLLQDASRRLPAPANDPYATWYRAGFDYLNGKADEAALRRAMAADDPFQRRIHECAGYFLLARDAQDRGDRAAAKQLFERSIAARTPSFYENALSRYELSQLGGSGS